MYMLQLIYQIDVWQHDGATSSSTNVLPVDGIGANSVGCANSFSKLGLHVIPDM